MAAAGGGGAAVPAAPSGAALVGKPKWLVLGGVGFIGRNLVKYLVDNGLASDIRIVDKRAPFMAFLSADYKEAIMGRPELIEFVQADVADPEMCEGAFREARSGGAFDYVVNCAAETAHGKPEAFYAKTHEGAKLAAEFAARMGVKKFVHLSTAHVYKPASSARGTAEAGKLGPVSQQAEAMLASEEAVKAVAGLPWVILRPAHVYGPGDAASLMPRCVIAATYKACGDKMELLWDGDLKLSTVHVFDVARAIFFAARKAEAGAVFNLADKGETDQGKLAALLSSVFGIEHSFIGNMKSNLAALKLDAVVDAANESHLGPWLALLKTHSIANTPLSPYLHKALLGGHHLCVDGAAIEAAGFKYAVPAPTADLIRDPIRAAIAQGIFPPIL